MQKKLFLTMLCAATIGGNAMAQSTTEEVVEYSSDKYKVETNRFWSNWFVSVGGGAQVYFGDHDKQCKLGNRLAPVLDVAVGKWFTPGIGIRLEYSGLQERGATQKGSLAHSTGEDVPGKGGNGYWLEKQKYNFGNIHADVMFNLTNLFAGYSDKRVWNTSIYGGLGWAMVWDRPQPDMHKNQEVSANVGWLNSFRLCKALDLNVDIRGMFVNDRFDGEGGGNFGEGNLSASVGLAYKFTKRGWERSKTVYRYDYGELEALRQQIEALTAENQRLNDAYNKRDNVVVQKVIKKMAAANLVIFPINKTVLSKEARANLGLLAELIKSGDPEAVYIITGYADAATGTPAINERLSKGRAEAVFNCLVKEFGVSESQLRMEYKGGVGNMFYNDPRLSRAVITKCAE